MERKNRLKAGVTLFALLYVAIGLGYLIGGASPDSRFFVVDNILVRFIGALLILSGTGLFLRKEAARKGIIAAISLAIMELFIGVPQGIPLPELVATFATLLMMFLPGLVFFITPKNRVHFN